MENQFENPSKVVLAMSFILFPLFIIYLAVKALMHKLEKAKVNRRHKKMFGRPMNFIESLMYDMDHPMKY